MAQPPTPPAPEFAWRLFEPAEWETVLARHAFAGSPLDARDGYIHLSLASEVRTTVERYFATAPTLILAKVALDRFASLGMVRMDYVASRSAFFPHVFDAARGNDLGPPPAIPLSDFVLPVHTLTAAPGGGFSGWPEGI